MPSILENDTRRILQDIRASNDELSIDPWVMTDHEENRHIDNRSRLYQAIAPDTLMKLMFSVVEPVISSNTQYTRQIKLYSNTRYCVSYHRPKIADSQLFVQHRDDYFIALELYIDGRLSVTFKEPLWPQLQNTIGNVDQLHVLSDCLRALQHNEEWNHIAKLSMLNSTENLAQGPIANEDTFAQTG